MRERGFTLVELLVVVTIIGILLRIAVPAYNQYTVRSNRNAVQADMMLIAANLERYRAQQLSYSGATSAIVFPNQLQSINQYTLTLTVPAAPSFTWTLTAVPKATGRQVGSGALGMDSQGRRCWKATDDTTCDLNDANQNWGTR